ncbi:MAG: acetate--CoA ligase family protein, partial [Alphaproteobacteria bacterium]
MALQVRGRTLPFHVVPRGSDECLLVVATEAPTRLRVALETAFAVVPAIFAGRVPEDLRTRVAILLRPTWDHVEASEHWLLHDRLSARRIPWRGVSRYGDRLTQVGEGRHGRVVRITMTQRTSRRAANLGVRKDRASPILRRHGLPLPEQHVVTDADGAVAAALAIGPPVVVKRVDGRAGLDVHVGLADADAVRAAFAAIPRNAAAVVVERMLPGEDHRLLVIAGRLVAAARKEPPAVVGDGRSTIAELVARRNREPERLGSCAVLGPYPPMPEVIAHLAASGRTPASVPADGERVVVHRRGDLDIG